MSYEDSSGNKLAEALLRPVLSTLNYEVIPPAPYDSIAESTRHPRKSNYYSSDRARNASSSLRRAAELAGYSLLASGSLPSGYSDAPTSSSEHLRTASPGDYYLSSTNGGAGATSTVSSQADARLVARLLAERLQQEMHLNRDFNKDYQTLMEQVDAKSDDLSVLTELRLLTKEFLDTAQSIGCIIIDELFEPHKTIPPVDIGGIAGGVKYVYRNILYKICLDTELDEYRGWMHGGAQPSHEKAMKTGAHELRGLMHYSSLRVSGLHFPLMLVMDYKGFRLVAEALLPINKETICYGSSDGGESVHASGETICLMMKTVGQELHLAPHLVKDKMLYGPGDQEVHQGLDGRYYCIDLARVFPCEPARHHLTPYAPATSSRGQNLQYASRAPLSSSSPKPGSNGSPMRHSSQDSLREERSKLPGPTPVADEPRSIFYKFFRPEFVLSYKKHLACDCFTAWGKSDPMFAANNKDIVDAFLYLRSFIIPTFADSLDKKVSQLPRQTDPYEWWTKEKPLEGMHAMGINLRHLGLVRSHCVNEFARRMILNEMLARTLKNMIRRRLREETEAQTRLSHEEVKDVVVAYYNWVLGKGPSPINLDLAVIYDAPTPPPLPLDFSAPPFTLDDDSITLSNPSEFSSEPNFTDRWSSSDRKRVEECNGYFPNTPSKADFSSSAIPSFYVGGLTSTLVGLRDGNTHASLLSSSGTSTSAHLEVDDPKSAGGSSEPTSLASSSSTILPEEVDTRFPAANFFEQFYYQFESALNREEVKDTRKTITSQLDRKMFFGRLNQMLGIEMDNEAEKELHHTTSYEFVHCDISSIAPRVRFMNLVDEAEGLALYITAKQKRSDQRKRLLSLATQKLRASCASLPHNFRGLYYWGRCLYAEAKVSTQRDVKINSLELALAKLTLVSKLRPLFSDSWVYQVKIWLKLFETPEYQKRILDSNDSDPLAPDFSHLTDSLHDACMRLIRLDLTWTAKLVHLARSLLSRAHARSVEPTSTLKVVRALCLAIQTVCAPMLEAYPSVPLPPDAVNIRLPRIYAESLLICARSLQLRSRLASERAAAAKPDSRSVSTQNVGINQDELHAKRLKFQLSEQIVAILALPHFEDVAYFDRVLLDAMSDIAPLLRKSKHLSQIFQQRCRSLAQVSLLTGFNMEALTSFFAPYVPPFFPQLDFVNYDFTWLTMLTPGGNINESFVSFLELASPHVGPNLTTIDLTGCKFVTPTSVSLLLERSAKNLTALDISDLPCISNAWLSTGTTKAENLIYLGIRGLKVTDDTAAALCTRHGKTLKRLDISYNSITNVGLYRMARELRCLEILDASGNTGIGAMTMVSLNQGTVTSSATPRAPKVDSMFTDAMSLLRPSLTALSLLECYSLSNQAIWDVSDKLRNLTTLSLATKQLSDQYFLKLEPVMAQLRSLCLKGLPNSDAAFAQVLQHLGPQCRNLSLRACMGISDNAIRALSNCVNLQALHIGLCTEIQGSAFEHLSQSIYSITDLDVSGLKIPSSGALEHFINVQSALCFLSVASMATPLTDPILVSILSNASMMRDLSLIGNTRITTRSLEQLPVLSPKLEGLSIADCHSLKNIEPTILRLKMLVYLNVRYAHPLRNHCLLESKFSHIQFLVVCHCDKRKSHAPPPSIASTLEKEITTRVSLSD